MPTDRAGADLSPRIFRFFLFNDMHFRNPSVTGRGPNYPCANEKARWAFECARGEHGFEPPDFIVSAGDIIDGELGDYDRDFDHLRSELLADLPVPFLPCLGNHENCQGEGIPEQNAAYDRCFGPGWRNYIFTCGGIAFIVMDTTGAHRVGDEVTDARNAFLRRALAQVAGMPVILVTHVPLIAMREEGPLRASFGFSSWRVLETGLLRAIDEERERVIAVLCGHTHLTGVQERLGIYHIMPAGTAGYPADFASFDVYADRIEVQMHRAPEQWLDRGGNIHGKPRWEVDYVDERHEDHEAYLWGNESERRVTVRLEGMKRAARGGEGLKVWREGGGAWEELGAGRH